MSRRRNVKEGDVVQLLDKEVRGKYPLGVIIKAYSNPEDGIVRVVEVKTKDGTYRRPITKLSEVLPFEDGALDEQEEEEEEDQSSQL